MGIDTAPPDFEERVEAWLAVHPPTEMRRLQQRIDTLDEECERLRQENDRLRTLLDGDRVLVPTRLRTMLTAQEERMLTLLVGRDLLSKESAMTLLYGVGKEQAKDRIVNVLVCRLRDKLAGHITIETLHARGYRVSGRRSLIAAWRREIEEEELAETPDDASAGNGAPGVV